MPLLSLLSLTAIYFCCVKRKAIEDLATRKIREVGSHGRFLAEAFSYTRRRARMEMFERLISSGLASALLEVGGFE